MRLTRPTFCLFLLLATVAWASSSYAGTISPEQAGSHIGQLVTVEGVVTEVHTARSGSATFIDMSGIYPNNAFTGVIFARDMAAVGDVSAFAGRTVDISGTVQLYRNRPEIIIRSASQIRAK